MIKKKRPTKTQLEAYRTTKMVLYSQQRQRCAWPPCCGYLKFEEADLVHLDGLGMGADRFDPDDPRNAMANLRLMHRACHQGQERYARQSNAFSKGLREDRTWTTADLADALSTFPPDTQVRLGGEGRLLPEDCHDKFDVCLAREMAAGAESEWAVVITILPDAPKGIIS